MTYLRFFPLPFLLGLAALAVVLPMLWVWKRSFLYLFVFSVFWVYLLMVAGLTLFPLPLPVSGEARRSLEEILSRVNLIPFYVGRGVRIRSFSRSELLANVLMTIPFGILFPWLLRMKAGVSLIFAVGIGLFIEGTQLAISLFVGLPYRVVDVNDVLMNTAGALVGYGVFRIANLFAGWWKRG